jgi:hypothetical protein
MGVRREVIDMIGGFDPLLGAGSPLKAAEDADLLARACAAGWLGVYDPRPVVAHHHGRKPGLEVASLRNGYAYGRGAYYAKALLDRSRRSLYGRRWAWTIRHRVLRGNFGVPAREIAGAVLYLSYRLAGSRERDSCSASQGCE